MSQPNPGNSAAAHTAEELNESVEGVIAEVPDLLQLGTQLSCEFLGSQDKEGNPHRTRGSPCKL